MSDEKPATTLTVVSIEDPHGDSSAGIAEATADATQLMTLWQGREATERERRERLEGALRKARLLAHNIDQGHELIDEGLTSLLGLIDAALSPAPTAEVADLNYPATTARDPADAPIDRAEYEACAPTPGVATPAGETRRPAIGDVVDVYTFGRWRTAKVDTMFGGMAFGWQIIDGIPQGGGATDFTNSAWRWPAPATPAAPVGEVTMLPPPPAKLEQAREALRSMRMAFELPTDQCGQCGLCTNGWIVSPGGLDSIRCPRCERHRAQTFCQGPHATKERK